MKHDEDDIVRPAVLKYLRKRGHIVFPHRTQAPLVTRGGKTFRGKFNPNYATAGEADLLVFAKSSPISPIWIELKKPGKRTIDPDQGIFRRRVQEMGHEYIVVQGEEDLISFGL